MPHVDFLNKNTLRSYPIRADCSKLSQGGAVIPTTLFCAAQFSVPGNYSKVALSRIYINDNYINILVSARDGNTLTYLGFFDGRVYEDFQRLTFSAVDPAVYGMLTIGSKDALLGYQGFHTFDPDNMLIEDSLVTAITPPAVLALAVGATLLTGRVGLELTNIQKITNPIDLQLDVVAKELVRATADKSAQFNNCPTNPIGSMNGVLPDENGNIDIYGIAPINVRITSIGLSLEAPSINRQELCAEETRIPPLITISTYLKDITKTTVPEWQTWPQYVKA